ncbi:DUF3626 domain-containing protein [Streptomyces sp. TR06-5]|uniref:DUF3626 domain-containing protein n=1 Tax=Streptomyces sp. TR06-5 TaxID=3385976 RepID=UPI0039A2C4D7
METGTVAHAWAERALRHTARAARGRPVAPALRVTANFHPDRESAGIGVLESLRRSGTYVSQFVTGTGNGGLTARPGGERWRWESRIFGGAYDGAPPHARPVYGALNHLGLAVGGAPRFGSAHFRLTADATARATFCYPDSCTAPADVGTLRTAGRLVDLARTGERDVLDAYVEAQIHGPVLLARDVEALVLDSCYRGTDVEAAARRLPCSVEWHDGFRLTVRELRRHPDFRGAEYVELGVRIAEEGMLDPRVLGNALRTGRYEPQAVKKVWHCLARFGAPAAPRTTP